MPSAVRFGVNYTPSEGWFPLLARLRPGLRTRRPRLHSRPGRGPHPGLPAVALLPAQPHLIRDRAVGHLVELVDAAGERGLDVNVDGLQGHLSSFNYPPAWTRTWHRRNLFTDPEVVDGQATYLRTLRRRPRRPAELPRHDPRQRGQPVLRRTPPRPRTGRPPTRSTPAWSGCSPPARRAPRAGCTCTPSTTPPGTRTISPSPRPRPPAVAP